MTDTPPRSPRNDEGPREKAWAAAYNDDGPAFEAAFDAALAEERRHVIEQIRATQGDPFPAWLDDLLDDLSTPEQKR